MAKFGAKYAFVVIFGQILAFFAHLMPYLNKQQFEQGAKVGFQLGGYQNFWIFAQIWPQKCIFGHIGSNIGIFVGWLVGGFGARAVSRQTPIYFIDSSP